MASQKHNYIIAKIILYSGRVFGITFGGIQVTPEQSVQFNKLTQDFLVTTNQKWKIFGYLAFLFYLAYAINRFFYISYRFEQQSLDTIIKVIYVVGSVLYVLHCCAVIVIFHCFGKSIFDFLSRQTLSRKQFRICLLVLSLPVVNVFCIDVMALVEASFKQDPEIFDKKASYILQIISFDIPWSLGSGVTSLLSILTYWKLNKISANLSINLDSKSNLLNQLTQTTKEFISLKNCFEKLNLIFAFLNITNFLMTMAFVLMGIPIVLKGNEVVGISELICDFMTSVLLCWVHGLPHKASRNLIHSLDNLAVQAPTCFSIQKTYVILTRNSIGFKLLGYNYDLELLPSVSTFLFKILLKLFN